MGATLYHMLTARHPRRDGSRSEVLAAALEGITVPVRERDPTLPEELASVLDRALETNIEKRFPDAAAMRGALLPLAEDVDR
jgi:hypothetical protein